MSKQRLSGAWMRWLTAALLVGSVAMAWPAPALADSDQHEQSSHSGSDDNRSGARQQTSRESDGKNDDHKKKGDDNRGDDRKDQQQAPRPVPRSSTPAPMPQPSAGATSTSSSTPSSSPTRPADGGQPSVSRPPNNDDAARDDNNDRQQAVSTPRQPKLVFVPPPTVVSVSAAATPLPPIVATATATAASTSASVTAVSSSSSSSSSSASSSSSSSGSTSSSSSRPSPASESSGDTADQAPAIAIESAAGQVQPDPTHAALDPVASDSANLALLDVPLPPVIGDIFTDLGSALGSWLGQPVAPVETSVDNCDLRQPTTLGVALWSCANQVSSFFSTDGRHRWAVLDGRLVQWLGPRVADPIDLGGTIAPAPWNLVCIGLNADQQDACVIGDGTVTGGVIDQPGADRVYLFQVAANPAMADVQLGNLPADYDLYLVDGSGAVVAASAQEGTLAEAVHVALQPGPYLLYVHSDPGRDVDPAVPFLLHLNLSPLPA